ncbi:hypothetical protein GL268_01635 [Aeromonas veronii]|nr:hypothetical protein [Aeromonas veronii]
MAKNVVKGEGIYYFPHSMTREGKAIYENMAAMVSEQCIAARSSQTTSPTQTKVLEKPAPYSSPSENVSTAILKIEAEDHTGTPGIDPLDAMLAELDKWVATNLGREDDV